MGKKLNDWLNEFIEGGADANGVVDWPKTYHGSGGEQIQADWNQTDDTKKDFIKNKPIIPDAVSGVNDGINWTSLTIGEDTYGFNSEMDITAQEIEEYFNEYCDVQASVTEEIISGETVNVLNLENVDIDDSLAKNLELVFNTSNVEVELSTLNIK